MNRIHGLTILVLVWFGIAPDAPAAVPEYEIDGGGVHIKGIDGTNPIIYDNDWWFDVFDNNYLWAQASLGKANLRANIVTRDMWDHPQYLYTMWQCLEDARRALELARKVKLRNIPDLTAGSDRVLNRPESGKIEDTRPLPTAGSRKIVR